MVRVAVVGLGKMGLSHHAMLNAHPAVEVAAVCDSSTYLLGVLRKYTGVQTYSSLDKMLDEVELDAILVATPSSLHARMVRSAIDRGVHVFCEKPFCLTDTEGAELTAAAESRNLVTQVGYHNRFVATFQEVKRLLDANAIGDVTHVLGEAYGPVVLRQQGGTWRSKSAEGGGCLYDYAAHPINLVNWYLGEPTGVGGSVLNRVFSREIDDEVFSTLYFEGNKSAQISVNWSDESVRKMTTRVTIWGTGGRIYADRQECQVFLRDGIAPVGYESGWNVRYITDLTDPVRFYLRGEEYSAQLDSFVARVESGGTSGENDFASATVTDRSISMLIRDARQGASTVAASLTAGGTAAMSISQPSPARWTRFTDGMRRQADRVRPHIARSRDAVRRRIGIK